MFSKGNCVNCYFVICRVMITGTPGQIIYGNQKTTGKGGIPVSFLTHRMNHSRKSNRLVINICQRKSSITFSEFGVYCSNNPFPKYLWFRKRPEIYLCLSPFGKLFESFLSTLWKSRWRDLCYIYWHENVNVLTVLSRALLRTFSKHGAWGLELTCMSTEDWFSDWGSVFVEEFLFVQPAHWVRVSSLQFPNHSTETKLYTAISGKVVG